MTNGYPECNVSEETFLPLHVYPGLLLLLTLVYGIAVFRIKRNFNEGRWVTCATVCIIPGELLIDPPTNIVVRSDSLISVFVTWALVFYFAPSSLHDPSIAVAIVAIAGLLLTTIFLPKMHTISQQSKYRKLKLHSPGSDSTVYTSYTAQQDFPSYSMYYPPNALYPGTGGEMITEIFGCQASVYPLLRVQPTPSTTSPLTSTHGLPPPSPSQQVQRPQLLGRTVPPQVTTETL